jgi:hypothetical protein
LILERSRAYFSGLFISLTDTLLTETDL